MRIVWALMALIVLASCARQRGEQAPAPVPSPVNVIGFCGPDAFRVEASADLSGNTASGGREEDAVRRATALARQKALEVFSAGMVSGRGDMASLPPGRVLELVDRGEVIGRRCGADGRCTVLFEVRAKNLKQSLGYTR